VTERRIPDRLAGPFPLATVAEAVGGELDGDGAVVVDDVLALDQAGPEHLSFVVGPKYARRIPESRAGALILDRSTDAGGRPAIRCDDPYAAFARALALFHPQPWPEPGVDASAWVHPEAIVDPSATIEAFAWVGAGARVGAASWIEAHAYLGPGSVLGERCRLMPGAVVYSGCTLGDRVWVNPGAVLGGEGFGFARRRDGNVKIPQTGPVEIGDDVEIGSNSCVDRSTVDATRIGSHVKLDNLVQVGHGASLGEGTVMAAFAGVAGNARIGKNVTFAPKSGAVNSIEIGDGAIVGTQSIALTDHGPGANVAGTPAFDRSQWLRAARAFQDLHELRQRVRRLEARLAELAPEDRTPPDVSSD